jgi:hypothetical protein
MKYLFFFLFFLSCGIEFTNLTSAQKQIEMAWLLDKLKSPSYAFYSLKEASLEKDWETFFKQSLKLAETSKTNQNFLQAKEEVINAFHDVHIASVELTPRSHKIKFLGFLGKNIVLSTHPKEYGLLVTQLLPSVILGGSQNFPLQIGDIISSVNGESYNDFVEKNCALKYSHIDNLPYQSAAVFSLLTDKNCNLENFHVLDLKIIRRHQSLALEMIYEETDMEQFFLNEREAYKKLIGLQTSSSSNSQVQKKEELQSQTNPAYKFLVDILEQSNNNHLFHFWSSDFAFFGKNQQSELKLIEEMIHPNEPFFDLSDRHFQPNMFDANQPKPKKVFVIKKHYPIEKKFELSLAKRPGYEAALHGFNNHQLIAYIKIKNFTQWNDAEMNQLEATIKFLKSTSPAGWVIDLIDNFGGSLNAGYNLLSFFIDEPFHDFSIQLAANENWVSRMEFLSNNSQDFKQRAIAKSILKSLQETMSKNETLTEAFPLSRLNALQNNSSYKKVLGNQDSIFVLVNGNCASMCDLFVKALQQRHFKIFGERTTGAGGNSAPSGVGPYTGDVLYLTESVILDQNGQLIEGEGVFPDEPLIFSPEDFLTDYKPTKQTIMDMLINYKYKKQNEPQSTYSTNTKETKHPSSDGKD